MLLEPENLVQGLAAVFPALVGVHSQRHIRYGADGFNHLHIRVKTYLYLKDIELAHSLQGFLLHHFRSIYADGEGGGRSLGGIQAPDAVPGLAHELAHEVVQGYIYGALGGGVSRGEAVHVGEDVFHLEGVCELGKVYLIEEGSNRFYALAQVRGHGSLSVTHNSFPLNLYLHVRRGGTAVGGHGEYVCQFQLVGEKLHVKLSVAFDNVELLGAAGATHEAGAYGCQACCFQKVASILHSRDWLVSC